MRNIPGRLNVQVFALQRCRVFKIEKSIVQGNLKKIKFHELYEKYKYRWFVSTAWFDYYTCTLSFVFARELSTKRARQFEDEDWRPRFITTIKILIGGQNLAIFENNIIRGKLSGRFDTRTIFSKSLKIPKSRESLCERIEVAKHS